MWGEYINHSGKPQPVPGRKCACVTSRGKHVARAYSVNSLTPSPEHSPAVEHTRWFMEEVQPHEPKIRAWLHARFPAIGDVDDLIQETYLRVLRARSAGKLDHPKAYLFATARNAALDRFRRNQVISFERLADVSDSSVLVDGQRAIDATQREQELDILAAAIR